MFIPEFKRGSYFSDKFLCELLYEVYEINGKKEGTYKEYYTNGKISKICNYVDDKLNGEHKVFSTSGLFNICNYVNGKKNGEYKQYFTSQSQNLYYSCNYINDLRNGVEKKYHQNGNI